MRSLSPMQFVSRGDDLGLRLIDGRGGLGQIVFHLRNFERRQHLSRMHAIAKVNGDRANVARNFRHQIDLLERLKFGGEHDIVCKIGARDFRGGDRQWSIRRNGRYA